MRFPIATVALLFCACGNDRLDADGGSSGGARSGGGGSASGGASSGGVAESSGGFGGDSASGGAGSDQGSGGAATEQCKSADGKLAYGPIGEPWPWPLETISTTSGDCSTCNYIEDYSAFRTTTGYGFVWRTRGDSSAPTPNLFTMTVNRDFEGGEPQALLAENFAISLEVTAAANGFVVSTCSGDSEPEWIWLDDDLMAREAPTFAPKGAFCDWAATPPVLWTGERYLTAFTDPRGLVLASLDEQGTLVQEEILSEEVEERAIARLSQSGDRVLLVFNPGPEQELRYRLFDLQGTPLSDSEPFGVEVDASYVTFAITPNGDGWWVINDTGPSAHLPATLTKISRDGLATPGKPLGERSIYALSPSSQGGSLLLTHWYEDDLNGHAFSLLEVVDAAGEIVFSFEEDHAGVGPFPQDVVVDPSRDLIVEDRRVDGSLDNLVIQEYGCLE